VANVLPFIIAGLTTGSVYGLAAVGLVLTYKTSGIFNFAHGALATVSAFMFYSLYVQAELPWWVAAIVCIFVVGPVLGLFMERIARAVAYSSLVVRVVATVGVLLAIQAVVVLIYGEESSKTVPPFLPLGSLKVGTTPVSVSDIIIVAFGLLATIGLYVYFRYARMGVAMRAVVDDPDLLDLAGTSPTKVRRYSWIIGSVFAAASGILLAPLVQLDATTLTLLVVYAFGAAAIGRFTSLPITYLGGVVIGLAAALSAKYFTVGLLASLPAAIPFLILFVVLLFSRRSQLGETAVLRPPHVLRWRAPARLQLSLGVVLFGFLLTVPLFAGTHVTDWTIFLAYVIVFLSLGLLVKTSGQVSLAHVAFMAIGAAAFAHFAGDFHIPWFLALFLAGLVAVPIGALLSIPAIRLSGLYLALATLGFGILVAFMFYTEPYMFGASGLGLTVPRPDLPFVDMQRDRGFYYLVLVLTLLATLLIVALNRSRLGRLLRALGDSPRGLATSGTSVNVTRVLVFCLSAFLAAAAGALAGSAQGNVSGDSYPPLLSLTFFALLVIQPGGEPWYAIIGGLGLAIVPSYFPSTGTRYWLELAFGVFAVLYAFTPEDKRGMPPGAARFFDRLAGRTPRTIADSTRVDLPVLAGSEADATAAPAALPGRTVAPATLAVHDLSVRFGGVVAVDGVSLEVPTGLITGLIGPNGAGKTTTFNAISGLNSPSSGTVQLDGASLSGLGAATRARRGLGRTFQRMELFDSLTVAQNVELGREGSFAGKNPFSHFLGSRAQHREVDAATLEALALCGITDLADFVVGALSTGQRRLVELARCLAGPSRLLLLDEPSSGLDRSETAFFGRILKTAVRERGLGILLVEHDMSLVTTVCDFIYVLDFGKPIFRGTAAEVMAAPIVRAAYLGGDEVEDELAATERAPEPQGAKS